MNSSNFKGEKSLTTIITPREGMWNILCFFSSNESCSQCPLKETLQTLICNWVGLFWKKNEFSYLCEGLFPKGPMGGACLTESSDPDSQPRKSHKFTPWPTLLLCIREKQDVNLLHRHGRCNYGQPSENVICRYEDERIPSRGEQQSPVCFSLPGTQLFNTTKLCYGKLGHLLFSASPSRGCFWVIWRWGWGPNLLQYKDSWWYLENQLRSLCLEEGNLQSNSAHQDEGLPSASTSLPVPLPAFLQSGSYNCNKGHIFPISKVFTLLNWGREIPELNRYRPGGAALSPGQTEGTPWTCCSHRHLQTLPAHRKERFLMQLAN